MKLRWSRPAFALLLLASLAAGGAALASWSHLAPAGVGEARYQVSVVGPTGALLHDNVTVSGATALTVLRAACERASLTVETEEFPGMGTYVRAIGGYRASGAAGWVFEVERDGTWVSGDRSAAQYPLHAGEQLRWSWTGGGA